MKSRIKMAPFVTALLTLLLSVGTCYGQLEASRRWNGSVSLGFAGNQLFGDLKEANRQYAGDQSTIWGQKASYHAAWRPGIVVNGAVTRWLWKPFGVWGGCGLGTFGTQEQLTVAYDPVYQGFSKKVETVTTQMYYASPQIGVAAKIKGFSLDAGLAANIFLGGRIEWEDDLQNADGTHQLSSRTGPLDTQDQMIFEDPEATGGIVDYTEQNPAGHGINPVWFSLNLGASYALWHDRATPFVACGWRLALDEYSRSRTPYFSLRNGVQAPYVEDLEAGSMVKGFSLSLGYRF